MGRHLLELGLRPGPLIGRILRQLYEQQLDGQLQTLDEGLARAAHIIQELREQG
jgi:tRNA nucleotidyltransferase (CCA-adding enzyme)